MTLAPIPLRRPPAEDLAVMPQWLGAKTAVNLAILGAKERPALGVAHRFFDGSEVWLRYELDRLPGVPASVYEGLGKPPLLCMVVIDRGIGIRLGRGVAERIAPSGAWKALQEVSTYLGEYRQRHAQTASIYDADTRSCWWWKIDA